MDYAEKDESVIGPPDPLIVGPAPLVGETGADERIRAAQRKAHRALDVINLPAAGAAGRRDERRLTVAGGRTDGAGLSRIGGVAAPMAAPTAARARAHADAARTDWPPVAELRGEKPARPHVTAVPDSP